MEYKNHVNRAIEGKVSDFLISEKFLTSKILSNSQLSKSIYKRDPGLFYSLSSSMLYKVDLAHRTVYFMIATPTVLETDVSPLYKIVNLGWVESGVRMRINLPGKGYFLTEKDQKIFVSNDLDSCRKTNGYLVCETKGSSRDNNEKCLENVLFKNTSSGCKTIIKSGIPECLYSVGRGGVLSSGCKDLRKLSTVRGLQLSDSITVPENQVVFMEHGSYKSVDIGGQFIQSRGHLLVEKELSTSGPTISLSAEDINLIPEGIETDLDLIKTMLGETDFVLKKWAKPSSMSWKSVLAGVLFILTLLGCGVVWKICRTKRSKETRVLKALTEPRFIELR